MIRLVIYDFDKTIYNGDTGVEVLKTLLISSPKFIKYIPHLILSFLRYIFKIDNSLTFKENLYLYLCTFTKEEWETFITKFWNKQKDKFYPAVIQQLQQDKKDGYTIGIISASPEILLYPIMDLLSADFLIGTIFTTTSYYLNNKIYGKNCKNHEKVNRLYSYINDHYPNQSFIVHKMYSDSLHDLPLFQIAESQITVEKDGSMRSGLPNKNNNY